MFTRILSTNRVLKGVRGTNGLFSVDSPFRKMSASFNPVETSMRSKLSTALKTLHLDVINESYMHNVPKGSETHFKIIVVSELFKEVPIIKRHRMINEILKDELKNSVHALSIVAKTPEQWEESEKGFSPSPACRGGFGK